GLLDQAVDGHREAALAHLQDDHRPSPVGWPLDQRRAEYGGQGDDGDGAGGRGKQTLAAALPEAGWVHAQPPRHRAGGYGEPLLADGHDERPLAGQAEGRLDDEGGPRVGGPPHAHRTAGTVDGAPHRVQPDPAPGYGGGLAAGGEAAQEEHLG